MEATFVNPSFKTKVNKSAIAGMIITGLCALFLLVDAIMKVINHPISVEGSVALGWPADAVQSIGITLLISTLLYVVPRTAFFGAILLTGYLGGAIATMVSAGQPLYFATVFAILIWVGLGLRDERFRAFITGKR